MKPTPYFRLDARKEQRQGELIEMAAEMRRADRPDDGDIAPEIAAFRLMSKFGYSHDDGPFRVVDAAR